MAQDFGVASLAQALRIHLYAQSSTGVLGRAQACPGADRGVLGISLRLAAREALGSPEACLKYSRKLASRWKRKANKACARPSEKFRDSRKRSIGRVDVLGLKDIEAEAQASEAANQHLEAARLWNIVADLAHLRASNPLADAQKWVLILKESKAQDMQLASKCELPEASEKTECSESPKQRSDLAQAVEPPAQSSFVQAGRARAQMFQRHAHRPRPCAQHTWQCRSRRRSAAERHGALAVRSTVQLCERSTTCSLLQSGVMACIRLARA